MKRLFYFVSLLAVLSVTTSCQIEDDIRPIGQDAFSGYFQPFKPIEHIQYDMHEEGVEAGFDSLTSIDRWVWSKGLLTQVLYDVDNILSATGASDNYYYSHGRLDSIVRLNNGTNRGPDRTYRFYYHRGLLSHINFTAGQKERTIEFLYHPYRDLPYAVSFRRPLEDWQRNTGLYGTDTIVQTWTLSWSNGNLVRATADSMAWYYTGLSHIEYFYDNHPNPFQGWYNANVINTDGFLSDPSLFSTNNMVRRVDYNYSGQGDTTYVHSSSRVIEYCPDGYPSSVTDTTPTLYWTTITTKTKLFYVSQD